MMQHEPCTWPKSLWVHSYSNKKLSEPRWKDGCTIVKPGKYGDKHCSGQAAYEQRCHPICKYAYILLFPADPPKLPALLQADTDGRVTRASTAFGRKPDGPLTLQGKGMLMGATGGDLHFKTVKAFMQ